ncbi:MAG: hypothetical protein RLZZ127_3265 [Planctomycetota bacterium]|jgi:hypothetical protein
MADLRPTLAAVAVALAILAVAAVASARGSGSVASPTAAGPDAVVAGPVTDPAVLPRSEADAQPADPAPAEGLPPAVAVSIAAAPAAVVSPATAPAAAAGGGDIQRITGRLPPPPPGKPTLPVGATWDLAVAEGVYHGVIVILPPPAGASVAVSIRRVPAAGAPSPLLVGGRLDPQGLTIPVQGPCRPGDRLVVSVRQGSGRVLGRTFAIDLAASPGPAVVQDPAARIVVDDHGDRTLLMPASTDR